MNNFTLINGTLKLMFGVNVLHPPIWVFINIAYILPLALIKDNISPQNEDNFFSFIYNYEWINTWLGKTVW